MDNGIEKIKNFWNQRSDNYYSELGIDERILKIIKNPESEFHHTTYSLIKEAFPNFEGKKICVPSSGGNEAVFAFHLMGAKVTSVDISIKQMENAVTIAKNNNWDIEFICDDTMKLCKIKSDEYDFVYTSEGVHVWINDLNSMYENIHRILKCNGTYIMYEIHPFSRPFEDNTDKIIVKKPYDSTGPFGEVPNYHWRMQDIMNAIISSGLNIKHIEEMYAEYYDSYWFHSSEERDSMSNEEIDKLYDWNSNPLAALPAWLSILARK